MRAPSYWRHGKGGLESLLLAPAGWCYGAGTALRQHFGKSARMPVPVICVGNLVAGGAGKTPVVMDIASRLTERGIDTHMLTRGYGGTEFGPLRVDADDEAARVGDEALLLARTGPTWIADDRVKGCREAFNAGAGAIVLDDGFQDPAVAKDLSLIVVDGGYGFGNGRMVPAGPLRESVEAGLARADAVVLIGDDTCGTLDTVAGRVPVLRARTRLGAEVEKLKGKPVFAFAGIARPEKFFDDLEAAGLTLAGRRAFADHHLFEDRELQSLEASASETGAVLATTEKDWVRLPDALRKQAAAVPMTLAWDEPGTLDDLLDGATKRNG